MEPCNQSWIDDMFVCAKACGRYDHGSLRNTSFRCVGQVKQDLSQHPFSGVRVRLEPFATPLFGCARQTNRTFRNTSFRVCGPSWSLSQHPFWVGGWVGNGTLSQHPLGCADLTASATSLKTKMAHAHSIVAIVDRIQVLRETVNGESAHTRRSSTSTTSSTSSSYSNSNSAACQAGSDASRTFKREGWSKVCSQNFLCRSKNGCELHRGTRSNRERPLVWLREAICMSLAPLLEVICTKYSQELR
jgi:hypothetical protein